MMRLALVSAVLVQVALVLYLYSMGLWRNARRLQLWVGAREADERGGVRLQVARQPQGLYVCGGCRDALLRLLPPGHAGA